jgi:hypothetical protein
MRFRRQVVLQLSFLVFLISFLSFRHLPNPDQDDKKKGQAGSSKKEKEKITDSLVGLHPYYLEMRGTVRKTKIEATSSSKSPHLDSARIKVFVDTTRLVAEYYAGKHGECMFRLPLNRRLRLEISKVGCFSKLIDIDTRVPLEMKYVYIFPFDLELYEFIPDFNPTPLQRPVAKVIYDGDKKNFEYDQTYTSNIGRDMKLLYKEYQEKSLKEDKKENK